MMIILSFLSYQDVFTTLISGYLNGVMIEGAANFGYDPIFVRGEKLEESIEQIKGE
jgi:inosine/xanthosine triphosphate pyrophosphatase family protein